MVAVALPDTTRGPDAQLAFTSGVSGELEPACTVPEVPLQSAFRGPAFILPNEAADSLCTDLGVSGLLERFNQIMGTGYDLSISRAQLLQHCIDNYAADFGQAFALLRPRWHMDPSNAIEDIAICQEADCQLREAAISNDIIIDSDIPPRRIWDLWSNRVVPIWMTTPYQGQRAKTFFAVSHSWMADELRTCVDSPINNHEWPVPIPCDTTLDRVRMELLHHTYKLDVNLVWLDVLCLRQDAGEAKEPQKLEEWKLDVPTIGVIYPDAYRVVYYFSGLGRPFEVGDVTSPRHWQNRAWTLQETTANRIVAGLTSRSPSMPDLDSKDVPVDDAIRPFYEKLLVWESFSHVVDSVWTVLEAMRHRSATNELDKIAGLNYYLAKFSPFPAYIRSEHPEKAWCRLIRATHSMQRADLFFLFPEPGDGAHIWCPSWSQVKGARALPQLRTIRQYVHLDEDSGLYTVKGHRIDDCFLEGLAAAHDPGLGEGAGSRTGTLRIQDNKGGIHIIHVLARHRVLLPDGFYTLLGGALGSLRHWVVGRRNRTGSMEKVSVLELSTEPGDGSTAQMEALSESGVVSELA